MANYLVWYGKKRATLLRREAELIRILHDGGPAEEFLRTAVELREAKVRYLESEFSRLDLGDGRHSDQLARLEESIAELVSMPDESIVKDYRQKLSRKAQADT